MCCVWQPPDIVLSVLPCLHVCCCIIMLLQAAVSSGAALLPGVAAEGCTSARRQPGMGGLAAGTGSGSWWHGHDLGPPPILVSAAWHASLLVVLLAGCALGVYRSVNLAAMVQGLPSMFQQIGGTGWLLGEAVLSAC